MKLPGVALATIESALNRVFTDQPGVVSAQLDNRSVCLHLDGLDTRLYLRFHGQTVYVFDELKGDPDATIRGTPVALATAGLHGQANTEDVQLQGDLQVAQAFEQLLKQIDIDWEELVSCYTGDAIAHQLGNLVRGFKDWSRSSANAFADDLRDYLQIETRQLPLPHEVEQFNSEVDEMRAAVERFELRVERLAARLMAEQNQ